MRVRQLELANFASNDRTSYAAQPATQRVPVDARTNGSVVSPSPLAIWFRSTHDINTEPSSNLANQLRSNNEEQESAGIKRECP